MDNWWRVYWRQEVAQDLFDQFRAENKFQIGKQVMAMRLNWETGYYFDAGKRFANMWKLMIGEPEWVDQVNSYDDYFEA